MSRCTLVVLCLACTGYARRLLWLHDDIRGSSRSVVWPLHESGSAIADEAGLKSNLRARAGTDAVPVYWSSRQSFLSFLLTLKNPAAGWQVLSTLPHVRHAGTTYRQVVSMKGSSKGTSKGGVARKEASSGFGKSAVAAPPAVTLEQRRAEHMALVQRSVQNAAPSILSQLSSRGYAIVDGLLPTDTILEMKSEADTLHHGGLMNKQTLETKYVNENNEEIYRYKEHDGRLTVYLRGGDLYYKSPRLHEFVSAMGSTLAPLINSKFPGAQIGLKTITPKLAVSFSQGSDLGKHIDNHGHRTDEGDTRKLTTMLYFNSDWEPSQGGHFRAFTGSSVHDEAGSEPGITTGVDEDGHAFVDIAPVGGRFLAFWADDLVHGVQPSLQEGTERWALTVWMFSDDPNSCELNMVEAKRHWPEIYGTRN